MEGVLLALTRRKKSAERNNFNTFATLILDLVKSIVTASRKLDAFGSFAAFFVQVGKGFQQLAQAFGGDLVKANIELVQVWEVLARDALCQDSCPIVRETVVLQIQNFVAAWGIVLVQIPEAAHKLLQLCVLPLEAGIAQSRLTWHQSEECLLVL